MPSFQYLRVPPNLHWHTICTAILLFWTLLLTQPCYTKPAEPTPLTPNQQFYLTLGAVETAVLLHEHIAYGLDGPFIVKNDDWFTDNKPFSGIDKITHLYFSYTSTRLFSQLYQHYGFSDIEALNRGTITSAAIMTTLEISDGFNHGFSWNDMLFNTLGQAMGYWFERSPALASILDFRIVPYNDASTPIDHYRLIANVKYFFALKFSGFRLTQNTPLRFVNLNAGYYTRSGTNHTDHFGFIGLSIDVANVLATQTDSPIINAFRYVQPPYTTLYAASQW